MTLHQLLVLCTQSPWTVCCDANKCSVSIFLLYAIMFQINKMINVANVNNVDVRTPASEMSTDRSLVTSWRSEHLYGSATGQLVIVTSVSYRRCNLIRTCQSLVVIAYIIAAPELIIEITGYDCISSQLSSTRQSLLVYVIHGKFTTFRSQLASDEACSCLQSVLCDEQKRADFTLEPTVAHHCCSTHL